MLGAGSFSEFSFSNQPLVQGGVLSVDANFTQTTTGTRIRTNVVSVISTFVTVKVASGTMTAAFSIDANFTQTTTAIRRRLASATVDANFTQTTTGTKIRLASTSLSGNFLMTTVGGPFWERIRTGANNNYVEITHTGDSWTEVNAGGNIQSWTKVEPPNGIN